MFRNVTQFLTSFVVAVAVLSTVSTADAYTVYFSETAPAGLSAPVPSLPVAATPGTSGSLYIYYNASTENYDFVNGSFSVSISSSTDGVIEFTGGTVYTPQFVGGFLSRWSGTEFVLGANGNSVSTVKGVSVSSAGFTTAAGAPSNAQPNTDLNNAGVNYVFAVLNYDVVGTGVTTLQLEPMSGFVVSRGTDVSGNGTFGNAVVAVVPEPASLALLGLGGLVAVTRRRRA